MKESESKDMLQKMLVRGFNAIVPLSTHRLAPIRNWLMSSRR